MPVVLQLLSNDDKGYFLVEISKTFQQKLIAAPDLPQSVIDGLRKLGYTLLDNETSPLIVKPLRLTYDDSRMLKVLSEGESLDESILESTIELGSSHDEKESKSSFDELRSPPKKKPFRSNVATNDSTNIIATSKFLVKKLEHDFVPAHLVRFLNKEASNLMSSKATVVQSCSSFLPDQEGAIVTFSSAEMAQEFVDMTEILYIEYEGERLRFSPYEDKQTEETQPSEERQPSEDTSDRAATSKILTEYEKTIEFVKSWLRLKSDFAGRNHEAAYACMHVDLAKMGIEWDIGTLRSKRGNLRDQYNARRKKNTLGNWEFTVPIGVIQGHVKETELLNTPFDVLGDTVEDIGSQLSLFTKGAVWTDSATRELIAIVTENRDEYEGDTRTNTNFFKEVSQVLSERKHFYTATQCERKLLSLKKSYRDEVKRLEKTGEPTACKFAYFPLMHDLMEGDSTVKPKLAMAVGVGRLTISTDDEGATSSAASGSTSSAASGSTSSAASKGITRGPSLRRPNTLNERKVKAIEVIAESLAKKYSP